MSLLQIPALVTLVALLLVPVAVHGEDAEPTIELASPAEGAFVGPTFVVTGTLRHGARDAVVRLGDQTAPVDARGEFRFAVAADAEGERKLRVLYAPVGVPAVVATRTVTIDKTPPRFEGLFPADETASVPGDEATVSGVVFDAGPVELRINGRKVPVAPDGAFESVFVLPAEGEVVVELVATDAAGNAAPAIVRRLKRGPALAMPVVSWEENGIFWLARDGGRIEIPDWSVSLSASIEAKERKFGPFGVPGHPTTVALRVGGVMPQERFQAGWLTLFVMRGAYQVQVPPPDPVTKSVNAVVVEVAPSTSNDGSWTIRLGTKSFVFPASYVERSSESDAPTSDEVLDTFIRLQRSMPDPNGSIVAGRIRTPSLVPVQLFDEVWRSVAIYKGVIVESTDAPVPVAAAAPTRRSMSEADRLRREAALAGPNGPMAVAAAKELADAGCVESIPALRGVLRSAGVTAVRGAAAQALGRLNDLDSTPALIELLKHPDGDLAADADVGLSSMSGLGRMLKSATPLDQRIPIAERYARWWLGAEAGLRKKKAAASPPK